jgi:hypothetical protein
MQHLLNLLSAQRVSCFSSPALVIGGLCVQVRQSPDIVVRKIDTADELNAVIDRYTGIPSLPYLLTLDDLAFTPKSAIPKLLKFIEDSSLDILLLSSQDVISPPLLSRMSLVVKTIVSPTHSNLLSPQAGRQRLQADSDLSRYDQIAQWAKESPLIYYNEVTVPNRPNRQKLLNLIEAAPIAR